MKTKDQLAKELIEAHFELESGISTVYRMLAADEDAPDEPIKLLEVNENTVPTGKVEPFAFSRSHGFPPTVIAEVTPTEFEGIKSGLIPLPEGWSLQKTQRFERNRAA